MDIKIKILIADNNKTCLNVLEEFFEDLNPEFFFTSDKKNVLKLFESSNPNIVFLSLNFAIANKWYLLKKIRKEMSPIIGLMEHENFTFMDEGKAYGFDAYLAKPLNLLHLNIYFPSVLSHIWPYHSIKKIQGEHRVCADRRLNENGRRWYDPLIHKKGNVNTSKVVHIGDFVIDNLKKCVNQHGKNLKLSPKEFLLFNFLVVNQGRVISAKEIIDELWHDKGRASEEDVKQYIHLLRKKIEVNSSHPDWIHTIKGFGYIFANCE